MTSSAVDERSGGGSTPTHGGGPPHGRARRHLVVAVALLLGFSAVIGLSKGVAHGQLTDTDAYSWVNRAVDLRTDGQWFDETIERIAPPAGHVQHWSRPFDVLLLVGGLGGAPLVGFRDALLGWAMVLPLLLATATLCALWWGFADVLDRQGRIALAVLLGTQPAIAIGFMAGRADHQALLGFLLVVVVGLLRRAIRQGGACRAAAWAGGVSALGMWVGLEFALVVAAVMIVYAVAWVRGSRAATSGLATFAATLTAGSGAALLLENGWPGALRVAWDELSIVVVLCCALVAATSLGMMHVRMPQSALGRVGVLLITGAVGSAAIVALFPAVLQGPLGGVDPFYADTRLRHINELQPLIRSDLSAMVGAIALHLSLLPFAVGGTAMTIRHRDDERRNEVLLVLLTPALLYLVLALGQNRWALPLNLLLAVPAALGARELMHAVRRRVAPAGTGTALVAVTIMWWVPVVALTSPTPDERCDPSDTIPALNDAATPGAPTSLVMAHTNHGPRLLFDTPHAVLSIPNHRPQPGYGATFAAMRATDMDAARDTVTDHGVDLVLVCTGAAEADFFGGGERSLHQRLARGEAPGWLRAVPTPTSGDVRMRLYEVIGPSAGRAAGRPPCAGGTEPASCG